MLQSSLHLHLLKTLEFRTDVSVTSIPGVAGATRASHFPITIFPWDPRPEIEAACQTEPPSSSACTGLVIDLGPARGRLCSAL